MTTPKPETPPLPDAQQSEFYANRLSFLLEILASGRHEFLSEWKLPLYPDGPAITRLSYSPGPRLTAAWRDFVTAVLAAADPSGPSSVTFSLSPEITALAVATANLLALVADGKPETPTDRERLFSYNRALLAPLVPADNYGEWLLYDALVSPAAELLRKQPPATNENGTDELFRALLKISPLSELRHLDLMLPEAISTLSGNYLIRKPGETPAADFSGKEAEAEATESREWWLRGEDIYADARLRRILIDRWLELPEKGSGNIGIGIFLEELRRRDRERFRRPILEFYEAYDYFGRRENPRPEIPHPEIAIVGQLLKAKSRALNRRGNERFLKFRALLEIIAEEQSVPREFKHLSRDFCLKELAPLARLATVIGGGRETLSREFSGPQFFDRPS